MICSIGRTCVKTKPKKITEYIDRIKKRSRIEWKEWNEQNRIKQGKISRTKSIRKEKNNKKKVSQKKKIKIIKNKKYHKKK